MTTGDKGAKHGKPSHMDRIYKMQQDEFERLRAINAELLESLRNILADDEVRDGDLPQDLVNVAWSVIAKAEGRA